MDYFDKKISELYDSDKTHNKVPTGLSWDEMESDILDRMESPKKNRRFAWMWFPTALIATIFLGGYFPLNNTSDSELSINESGNQKVGNNPTKSELLSTKNITYETDDNKVIKSNQAAPQSPFATNNDIEQTKQSSNFQDAKRKKSTASNEILKSSNQITQQSNNTAANNRNHTKTTNTQSQEITPHNTTATERSNTHANTTKQSSANLVNDEVQSLKRELLMATANLLDVDTKYLNYDRNLMVIDQDFYSIPTATKESKSNVYWIGINGGSIIQSSSARTSFNSNHLTSSPGFQIGADYLIEKDNGWSYGFELTYRFEVDKFDFMQLDSFNIYKENVVLGTQTNSVTGSSTTITGNTHVAAFRTRRQLQYNTRQTIGISAIAAKSFNLNSQWSIAPNASLSYYRLIAAEGTVLDSNNETFDYTLVNSPYQRNLFSAGLSIETRYLISNRFQLHIAQTARLQINSPLTASGSGGRSRFSVGGGIRYRL